jgi:hypothetical protein
MLRPSGASQAAGGKPGSTSPEADLGKPAGFQNIGLYFAAKSYLDFRLIS